MLWKASTLRAWLSRSLKSCTSLKIPGYPESWNCVIASKKLPLYLIKLTKSASTGFLLGRKSLVLTAFWTILILIPFPSLFVLCFSPCFSCCISYVVPLFYTYGTQYLYISGFLSLILYSFFSFLQFYTFRFFSLYFYLSVSILYYSISFLFHFSHFLVLIIFLIHFIVELLKSFCCSKYTGTCRNFVEPAPCNIKYPWNGNYVYCRPITSWS